MKLAKEVKSLCENADLDKFKEKHPYVQRDDGKELVIKEKNLPKDKATEVAKELRAKGIHASIYHMEGPATGSRSKYFVII